MHDLVPLLIIFQSPIVAFLAVVSLQGVQGFKSKALYIVALGWMLNLLYLYWAAMPVITRLLDIDREVPAELRVFESPISVAGNAAFLLAATIGIRRLHGAESFWGRLPAGAILLVAVSILLLSFLPSYFVEPHDYLPFVLVSLPVVLFSALSILALNRFFGLLAADLSTSTGTARLTLRVGMISYASIQPLFLLSHSRTISVIGDVGIVGFAAGTLAKTTICFGVIGLFVAASAAYREDVLERKYLTLRSREISRVAHELGTPIAEVLQTIPKLSENAPRRGLFAGYIAQIESAALRSAAVLDAAKHIRFDFAESREVGHLFLRTELLDKRPFNVNTLVHIAVMSIKETRPEAVFWSLSYSRSPCIRCVPAQIVQILINLLRNSCDALRQGAGRIQIRTTNLKDVNNGGGELERDMVRIEVCDSGEGISEALRERVFEDGFTTRGGPDRGHGLSVVKDLVEANAGEISLASGGELSGTSVVLVFPRIPCKERDEARAR